MKKTAALLLGLLLSLTALTAAGGTQGDPLISLSYLTDAFTQSLESAVSTRLDASDDAVRAAAGQGQPALPTGPAGLEEHTLKEGDVLSGSTGLVIVPLGGGVTLDVSGGAVVDVTGGTEVFSGALLPDHRYIVAENSQASFTVTTPAAVMSYEGGGILTRSLSPDYYSAACALREAGLFRGSGSGVGDGFDLYLAPTRGESLVMFLRLLGEEADALAYTGAHPFTDVPGWLDRYVAWAWQRGYTSGVAADRFGSDQPVSAVEYEEFLLRALGYSTAGVDDYTTSLERALGLGALTQGEYTMLRETVFLRAHAAYVSWYSLDMPLNGGTETLARHLISAGRMTEAQLEAARTQINFSRIS